MGVASASSSIDWGGRGDSRGGSEGSEGSGGGRSGALADNTVAPHPDLRAESNQVLRLFRAAFKKAHEELAVAVAGGRDGRRAEYDYGSSFVLVLREAGSGPRGTVVGAALVVKHPHQINGVQGKGKGQPNATTGGNALPSAASSAGSAIFEVIWFAVSGSMRGSGAGTALWCCLCELARRTSVLGILVTSTNNALSWWTTRPSGHLLPALLAKIPGGGSAEKRVHFTEQRSKDAAQGGGRGQGGGRVGAEGGGAGGALAARQLSKKMSRSDSARLEAALMHCTVGAHPSRRLVDLRLYEGKGRKRPPGHTMRFRYGIDETTHVWFDTGRGPQGGLTTGGDVQRSNFLVGLLSGGRWRGGERESKASPGTGGTGGMRGGDRHLHLPLRRTQSARTMRSTGTGTVPRGAAKSSSGASRSQPRPCKSVSGALGGAGIGGGDTSSVGAARSGVRKRLSFQS